MIKAEIIADSKNEFGNRITTMIVTFPRFILAEFNTHRMLSKNSASSRAIPFEKLIKSVKETPFIPIAWQKNHSGMQGTEYCTSREHEVLNSAWLVARDKAIEQAEYMVKYANPTKQLVNRLLEPFMYHTCIVTATEWENFFHLRCAKYTFEGDSFSRVYRSKKDALKEGFTPNDEVENPSVIDWLKLNKGAAEIHMMALAEAMWDAYNESTPKELKADEWHIPFGDDMTYEKWSHLFGEDSDTTDEEQLMKVIKVSTAHCAGVSYTVVGEDGKPATTSKLIARHDMLAKMGHWSPFEHCAKAMSSVEYDSSSLQTCILFKENQPDSSYGWSGNLKGFIQYRKMFDNENVTTN